MRLDAEPAGTNCPAGGTAIRVGVDGDGNAVLSNAEITSTTYVCNGAAGQTGQTALVRLDAEPAGANCPAGGTAVRAGIDADGDGLLSVAETTSTTYVCGGVPGADGRSTLVRLDAEPAGANCAAGGTAVRVGYDTDNDGVLSNGEIASTSYLCRPVPTASILVLQPDVFGFPGFAENWISRIDRPSGAVTMSVEVGAGQAASLVADPIDASFWVSMGSGGVQRRSIATGRLLDAVAFTPARDMVRVGNSLYVGGFEEVGVIDLLNLNVEASVALQVGDQTVGIAASPDGSEVVQVVFDGSNSRLVFIDTATRSISQNLAVTGMPFDVVHLGNRVVTWDDNADELRFYDPSPWAEAVGERITLGSDGGASFNAFNNMRHNPADGRIYLFRALSAQVLRVDPTSPASQTPLPLSQAYTCMVLDPGGLGLEGMRFPPRSPGFEHMALPGGATSPSTLGTSALPVNSVVTDLVSVSY